MDHIQKQKTISRDAGRWARFARTCGARFDVERKAAEAAAFCLRRDANSFAVPSKLIGTKQHQADLEAIAHAHGWTRLDLHADDDAVWAVWHGSEIGRLQAKHDGWVLPLLATGRLACYVLQITGGTDEKPTRGCNVVLTGITAALDLLDSDPAATAAQVLGRPAIDRTAKHQAHHARIEWYCGHPVLIAA